MHSYTALVTLHTRLQRLIYKSTHSIMLKSIRPLKALIRILMMTFVIMSSSPSTSSWGIDARYLPTRSDPLLPIGPPRGEDPRFDRLSDIIIRELLQNGGGDMLDDAKYQIKSQLSSSGPYK